jgi:pyruvate dehydrogenase E2 component (dihydrolipoamide acetyltransferase)
MEEGTFVGWLKKDGEHVNAGDPLFILDSDKAAEEIETPDAGILRLPPDGPKPGDIVKVGQVLAYLVAAGEPAPVAAGQPAAVKYLAGFPEPAAGPAVRRLANSLGVDITEVAGTGAGGRVTESDIRARGPVPVQAPSSARQRKAASPRARRVAGELGIDWNALEGSGRNGRVRERDVRAAAADRGGGRLIPHTRIRRQITARMVAGVTQAAPVTLTTKADATSLVDLRKQFETAAVSPDEAVPTYTDLVVKLAAVALKQHPLLQAQWREEGLFVPNRIDIAIAVDTEAGLLVPVAREADRLTLRQLAGRSRELVRRARAGQLTADDMRDATFTVTNLGNYGIDAFTPIIHLPQSAVLGVGRIMREPAVVGDQLLPRDMVTLSLTFDHRVVDGAPAARFLNTLRGGLERPAVWLIP